jgi:hypothetical protein
MHSPLFFKKKTFKKMHSLQAKQSNATQRNLKKTLPACCLSLSIRFLYRCYHNLSDKPNVVKKKV